LHVRGWEKEGAITVGRRHPMETDVLVVGVGPVGLMMAAELVTFIYL
jgi:NADPH-dependent 2,4-dienoyl-CoA reductase/sulfur reductase-like enzyme